VGGDLVLDHFRLHLLGIRVGRIFNIYGPRRRPNDDRVVNNFGDQTLKGKPLIIFGNGTQTPSFCYIGDLVEEILRFVAAEYKGIDTAG